VCFFVFLFFFFSWCGFGVGGLLVVEGRKPWVRQHLFGREEAVLFFVAEDFCTLSVCEKDCTSFCSTSGWVNKLLD